MWGIKDEQQYIILIFPASEHYMLRIKEFISVFYHTQKSSCSISETSLSSLHLILYVFVMPAVHAQDLVRISL